MKKKKIRYAVVGLGHIAQAAVLPAFKNASRNSELTALVSSDPVKLKKLGKKYGVKNLYSYDEYGVLLESGLIDAAYIATPNTEHLCFAEPALERGIHVLCEKPLAISVHECKTMIAAAQSS